MCVLVDDVYMYAVYGLMCVVLVDMLMFICMLCMD